MKKVKQIGLIMLIGISTVLINGCAKDGATGPAGKDGNANVSGSTSVTTSSWTLTGGIIYSTTITWTPITQAIADKGVVMVYEQVGSSGWNALPYTLATVSRTFSFGAGFVNVMYTNTDGSAPSNPGTQTYRVVAIAASGLSTHPNVNWKNYQEVKTAFGLPN